jgi:hypothetical protein
MKKINNQNYNKITRLNGSKLKKKEHGSLTLLIRNLAIQK